MTSAAMATADEKAVGKVGILLGKRKAALIAAAVLILASIAAGLWFSGLLQRRSHEANGGQLAAIAEKPTLVDVPDIITNLDNGGRRPVFIKLKAKIEVAHVKDQTSIDAEMPRILDAFQTYLRSLRPEELHGGEGVYRLREAMMNRINVITSPVQISDILFVEMLVQ